MQKGTVKFFDGTKGFGFITDGDSGKEFFVHSSGVVNSIKDGDDVTFDIQEGKRGPVAGNVRIA